MRMGTLVAASLLALLPLPAMAGPGISGGDARFPAEILGVWDEYPLPCLSDGPSDSDMRVRFNGRVLHAYEHNDELHSIQRVAEDPLVWRVVAISDNAPADIQGEADIYVLRGNVLTITNGERAYTYIRCR